MRQIFINKVKYRKLNLLTIGTSTKINNSNHTLLIQIIDIRLFITYDISATANIYRL